ncbi:MAG: hypothetical protein ACRDE7_08355 [Sphingobacterium sp.]
MSNIGGTKKGWLLLPANFPEKEARYPNLFCEYSTTNTPNILPIDVL